MRKLAVVSFALALHVDRRRKQEAARDEPVVGAWKLDNPLKDHRRAARARKKRRSERQSLAADEHR